MEISENTILTYARKHKVGLIVFIILCMVSLISLTWFDGDYTMGAGDHYQSIDRYRYLSTIDSAWRSETNTGMLENSLQNHLPASLFFIPLTYIGFNPVIQIKLWMFLSLFLPGLFMYLFLDRFLGKEIPYWFKLAGSLFYLFNPISVLNPIGISQTKLPVYLAIPTLSYLLLLIFDAKDWVKKIVFGILFAIVASLFSGMFGNVAEVISLLAVILFIFIYKLYHSEQRIKHILLIFFVTILYFSLNLWWLVSSFYNLYLSSSYFIESVDEFTFHDKTYMFDSLRVMGFWALMAHSDRLLYFLYGPFFYKPIGVLATYIVPVLVFSSLYSLNLKKKIYSQPGKVVLFLILSLISVFLVKGSGGPFGHYYSVLLERYNFLRAFREPYAKFSLITLFSYSVVITFSLFAIYKMVSLKIKIKSDYVMYIVVIIFAAIITYITYPMFTGEFVPNYTYGSRKQMIVKIPQYWMDLAEYTNNNNLIGRVLTVPVSSYYRQSYIWESGFVGNPNELFVNGSTVTKRDIPYDYGDLLITQLYSDIENYNTNGDVVNLNRFVNLSRFLNLEYILQMNDFDWLSYGVAYNNWSPTKMEEFYADISEFYKKISAFGEFTPQYLGEIPYIMGGPNIFRAQNSPTGGDYAEELLGKNGLVLYKMDSKYILPKIYIADSVIFAEDLNNFFALTTNTDIFDGNPLFVHKKESSLGDSANYDLEQSFPVNFEKITDGRYKVVFSEKPTKTMYLVFSESFQEGWKLAKNCGTFGCEFIDAPHFLANFYANGWLITPENLNGADQLYIVNNAEFRLAKGIAISIFAFVASVIGLVFLLVWDKKSK